MVVYAEKGDSILSENETKLRLGARIIELEAALREANERAALVEIRRALRAKRECLGVLCTDDEHNVMSDPAGADDDESFYGGAAGAGKSFDEKAWADALEGYVKR